MALIVIISLTNATDSVFVKAVLRVDNESESGQFPDLRFTKSPAESQACPDDKSFVVTLAIGFSQTAGENYLRLGGPGTFCLTIKQKP